MVQAYAKYSFLLVIVICLSWSCSDGCDNQCVNGSCLEDTCLCESGYEGEKCEIIAKDFSGLYYGESLTYTECDNPMFNETTIADNQYRFCEPRGERRYCREVFLEIRNDKVYQLTIADVFISPSTPEVKIPDIADGVYTTDGDKIVLCATENNVCNTMIRSEDGSQLVWTREGSTCKSTYLMIIL